MSVQLIFGDCWGKLTKKRQIFKVNLNNCLNQCKNHQCKVNCKGFHLTLFLTDGSNIAQTPCVSVGAHFFQHIFQ